jgi:gas vesicle protein
MNKKFGKILLGMLISGAAAGSYAFLYKSKKGKKMREDLKFKKDELLTKADEFLLNAKVKADKMIKNAGQSADSILKDANKILLLARKRLNKNFEGEDENLNEEIRKFRNAMTSVNGYSKESEESRREDSNVPLDDVFNDSFVHPDIHERKKSSDRQFHKMKISMDIDENELEK